MATSTPVQSTSVTNNVLNVSTTINHNVSNTSATQDSASFENSVSAKSLDNSNNINNRTDKQDTHLNMNVQPETEFATKANNSHAIDKNPNAHDMDVDPIETTNQLQSSHKGTPVETQSIAATKNHSLKEEKSDTKSSVDLDQLMSEKQTNGLKVLSNVQVSPNTILNVSSINSQISEPISLNNMIIVGSIPSTSAGVTSQHALTSHFAKPKSLLKSVNDSVRNGNAKILKSSKTKPTNDVSRKFVLIFFDYFCLTNFCFNKLKGCNIGARRKSS